MKGILVAEIDVALMEIRMRDTMKHSNKSLSVLIVEDEVSFLFKYYP